MSSTLVSLYPREFDEFRASIYPSKYWMPPSDGKIPQTLIIKNSFYFIENLTGSDRPAIKMNVPAEDMAASLIYDFKNSAIETDPDAYPAVFFIPEPMSTNTVIEKYQKEMASALLSQRNWFGKLVKRADDDWEKYHQHRMIGDIHRSAANFLGFDREWLLVIKEVVNCQACKTRVDPTAIICANCRCILNPKAYSQLQFAGAEKVA